MKTAYKIILLVAIACLCSIFIYYRVEKVKEVPLVESILETQQKKELSFLANSTDYTFDNPKIVVDPYGISPLTALIIFETKDLTSPTVRIEGKNEATTISHTFTPSKKHILPIYGLYPNTKNKVTLTVNGHTKELTITTDPLPKDFVLPTKVEKKGNLGKELYFVTPSSKGYTAAYDQNGDVRWYLTTNMLWDIKRLENGHLLLSSDRLINPPYYTTGLMELDLTGKIYTEYTLPGGYHHDVFEMENGNLLVASDSFESGRVEDYVVELDRKTGKIVKTFDLSTILPMEEGQNLNSTEHDWFHNNALWYDAKTNSISLSGRHRDVILNIDYDSSEINWILGDPTNWSKKMQEYFLTPLRTTEWQYGQHSVEILPNGDVFLFDNGNHRSKTKEGAVKATDNYSRGVIYRVDKNKKTVEQIWQYGKERGSDFYSPYISDVDYLGENHYLILSGGISYTQGQINNEPAGLTKADSFNSIIVEVENDKTIFELQLPTNDYRVEKMSLYANEVFQTGKGSLLGNMGITPTSSKKPWLWFNKAIDDNYKNHNITIHKEIDRLVISGTFKKEDKVQIILDNMFDKKAYDVRVSKTPYTAMCLDIFNEKEEKDGIKVTKYINDKGLKGKYYIYLKINNTIYDTDLYIEY